LPPVIIADRAVVAPFVNAHLLADQGDARIRSQAKWTSLQRGIDRNGRLMGLRYSRNNVLRTKGRVTRCEDPGMARGIGNGIHNKHAVAVKLDAAVALNPGKTVLLANSHQHIVTFED